MVAANARVLLRLMLLMHWTAQVRYWSKTVRSTQRASNVRHSLSQRSSDGEPISLVVLPLGQAVHAPDALLALISLSMGEKKPAE